MSANLTFSGIDEPLSSAIHKERHLQLGKIIYPVWIFSHCVALENDELMIYSKYNGKLTL